MPRRAACPLRVVAPFVAQAVDLLLIINAIVLIVEERMILFYSYANYEQEPWAQDFEISFTLIFTLEMSAKLAALGWYEYIDSLSNRFDGCVTLLSIACAVVALATTEEEEDARGNAMIRYVLALRLGRFCRLLSALPQVSVVVATFLRMLPAAAKLLKVLFVTLFVFSSIGAQLFGGCINYGPQYATLQNSTFGQSNYYANNFNARAARSNARASAARVDRRRGAPQRCGF